MKNTFINKNLTNLKSENLDWTLLQSEMKPEHIKNIIVELLNFESKTRIKMMNDLDKVKIKLGTPGVYIKIAEEVLKATKQ